MALFLIPKTWNNLYTHEQQQVKQTDPVYPSGRFITTLINTKKWDIDAHNSVDESQNNHSE